MSRITASCEWLLRRPLVWGVLGCLACYALISDRSDPNGIAYRLLREGQWPWKAAICLLFCTGIAQLALRTLGLVLQMGSLRRLDLGEATGDVATHDHAAKMLARLAQLPAALRNGMLAKRLQAALDWIAARRSAEGLDERLSTLSANDHRQLELGFSTARAIVLAVGVTGLTGTLASASAALHQSASAASTDSTAPLLTAIANSLDPAVESLAALLILAIGGKAAAHMQRQLATEVDRIAEREILGRFGKYGFDRDAPSASVARMSETILQTVSASAQQHDAALGKSLALAGRRWEEMASSALATLQRTMSEALAAGSQGHAAALGANVDKYAADLEGVLIRHAEILNDGVDRHTLALAEALEHHAAVLTAAEQGIATENRRHFTEVQTSVGEALVLNATRQERLIQQGEDLVKELQVALVESAGAAVTVQEQLVRQSELLLKVTESTEQIRRLEESLNGNLSTLAATHGFAETADNLAAAVQLLAGRLRQPAIIRRDVELIDEERTGEERTSQAA